MKDWLRHITLAPKVRRPVSVVGDSKTIGPISISVQVTGDPEWSRRICRSVMDAFVGACRAQGLEPEVTETDENGAAIHYHSDMQAHGGYAAHSHEVRDDHKGVPWGDKAK